MIRLAKWPKYWLVFYFLVRAFLPCFLTTGMIGYGMAKAAVHQLCRSLGGDKSGLPAGAAAVAILP